jgi:hypothetical protein
MMKNDTMCCLALVFRSDYKSRMRNLDGLLSDEVQ